MSDAVHQRYTVQYRHETKNTDHDEGIEKPFVPKPVGNHRWDQERNERPEPNVMSGKIKKMAFMNIVNFERKCYHKVRMQC